MALSGLFFFYDLFFAMLLQTWAFVTFNKVQSEPHTLYYLHLLPLVAVNNGIIHSSFCNVKGLRAMALYCALMFLGVFQSFQSFRLDFLGQNAYSDADFMNQIHFGLNFLCLVVISRCH